MAHSIQRQPMKGHGNYPHQNRTILFSHTHTRIVSTNMQHMSQSINYQSHNGGVYTTYLNTHRDLNMSPNIIEAFNES